MKKILVMEFDNIKADLRPDLPYDIALQECLLAKDIALSKGDFNTAGHACKGVAECYRRLGHINKAIQEYGSALDFFQETKNLSGIARTKWATANVLRQQCEYIRSINLLNDAYQDALIIKDYLCVAYSLAGIAETTRILGDYAVSISQHSRALGIFNRLQDYRGIVWAYEGIAQMHKNCGNIKKALRLFGISLRIAEETKDMRGVGYALKGIGEIFGIMGSYQDAINHLMMALLLFEEIKLKIGQAYTHKTMGDTYLRCAKYENAISNYNKAFTKFEESKDQRGIAYVTEGIGDLNRKIGFFEEATKHYLDSQAFFKEQRIRYGFLSSSMALRKLGMNNGGYIALTCPH